MFGDSEDDDEEYGDAILPNDLCLFLHVSVGR
jgi:hypothetical protein